MNEDVAISVKNLHKSFRLPRDQHSGVKQYILNAFRDKKTKGYEDQHVLKGIDFEVKKGEFFGIVGRNGSGKSTLLKLLAGIYVPDRGRITVNGTLVPFIELGVGFNPELTGRENVYLNGALLGFSRSEMEAMYDEIVEFAELERFMDQRLKNYSSGMQVRLAFSIAIRADTDILVLDEVLAVGDEAFQRKCNDYFTRIRQDKNKTVILVTHDMGAVKKYCDRAVLIKDGNTIVEGDPDDVANEYTLENTGEVDSTSETIELKHDDVDNIKVRLLSNKRISEKDEIKFEIEYETTKNINTVPAISITDMDKNVWVQNDNMWNSIVRGAGRHKVRYTCKLPEYISDCTLKIQVSVWSDEEEILGFVTEKYAPRVIVRRGDIRDRRDKGIVTGLLYKKGDWEIIE